MTPDQLFQLTGPMAMLGWLSLVLAPFAPRLTDAIAALVIPALLSVAYTGLILVHWAGAPGVALVRLADVMALFTEPCHRPCRLAALSGLRSVRGRVDHPHGQSRADFLICLSCPV
jgi:hypothetical protein